MYAQWVLNHQTFSSQSPAAQQQKEIFLILLARKKAGDELDFEPRLSLLHEFIESSRREIDSVIRKVPPSPNKDKITYRLNALFLNTLNSGFKQTFYVNKNNDIPFLTLTESCCSKLLDYKCQAIIAFCSKRLFDLPMLFEIIYSYSHFPFHFVLSSLYPLIVALQLSECKNSLTCVKKL